MSPRLEAGAGLFLLVRGEGWLAAEFDAVCLGVGPAARGALQDAAALQLGGDAKDGEDDLGKVGRGIEVATKQAASPDLAPPVRTS